MKLLKNTIAQQNKTIDGWLYICGDRLYNVLNKEVDKRLLNEQSEIIEVNTMEDADWNYLRDNFSNVGFINPNGTYYGCSLNIVNAADFAKLVLKSDVNWLLGHGWIYAFQNNYEIWGCFEPTSAQLETMKLRGINNEVVTIG